MRSSSRRIAELHRRAVVRRIATRQHFLAVRDVPVVGLGDHLRVRVAWLPAELGARRRDVEVHLAPVHQRVIVAQRRDAELVRHLHRDLRRPERQRADRAARAGVPHQAQEQLAHAAEAIGAAQEGFRAGPAISQKAGAREVVGVDELVAVVAVAQQVQRAALSHPLEQDLEDAEPAVAEDGARAHDAHVETACDVARRLALALELGAPVGLPRARRRALVDGIFVGHAVDRARRHQDQLAHAGGQGGGEHVVRAGHVDRPELLAVLRERHLGDVVVDDVDALHGAAHDVRVAHVAADNLDVGGAVRVVDPIEHAHAIAALAKLAHDHLAEVAAAAGDECVHGWTCSGLRRLPWRSRKWSTLRRANAITLPWGFTPGESGSMLASFT